MPVCGTLDGLPLLLEGSPPPLPHTKEQDKTKNTLTTLHRQLNPLQHACEVCNTSTSRTYCLVRYLTLPWSSLVKLPLNERPAGWSAPVPAPVPACIRALGVLFRSARSCACRRMADSGSLFRRNCTSGTLTSSHCCPHFRYLSLATTPNGLLPCATRTAM